MGKASSSSSQYHCTVCGKVFNCSGSLYSHKKTVHAIYKSVGRLSCDQCLNVSFNNPHYLMSHMAFAHGFKPETCCREFRSFEEFQAWKEAEEQQEKVCFVSGGSAKRATDGSMRYYYHCHRSGRFKPTGSGKRRLKAQGSCRTGVYCMASLVTTVNGNTGAVTVVYQKTHYGHEIDLSHIRLSRAEKEVLVGQLSKGLPYSTIIAEAKSSLGRALSKIHLISRKDLYNLEKSMVCKKAIQGTEIGSATQPLDGAADSVAESAVCEESVLDCIARTSCAFDEREGSSAKQSLLNTVRELCRHIDDYVGGDEVLVELEQQVSNWSHCLEGNYGSEVVVEADTGAWASGGGTRADGETPSLEKKQRKEVFDHIYCMKQP